MSNALDSASLVMIPSGYEDGTLGSVKPTDGTGDFTFTRGSNLSATRIKEDGYIEKGYENLLLQSNTFDTTWSSNPVLTPNQAGYDGGNNAWLVEKLAAFNNVGQSVSLSGVQTFSVYAKAGTQEWIRLRMSGSQTCYYHLFEDGYLGTNSGTISQNIDPIGNGWYRCSITISATTSNVNIYSADDDGVMGTSGSIYIQDAQLNQGLVAYPYLETTTASVAGGILEDTPRLDWSGSCPSLLLEPSRTNVFPYSEYFQGWHSDNNVSYSVNDATSPEGLINATKLTATSTSNSFIRDNRATSAGENVFSVFAKYEDCQYISLRAAFFTGGDEPKVWFDIQNGVKGGSTGDNVTYDIEDYGNGWYRCYVVFNVDAGDTNGYCYVYLSNADESFNVINGTGAHIYGAQLEQDATHPTSYIPTYGSSATRLKDVCDVSDVASLIGQTEGTYVLDWIEKYGDSTYNIFGLSDGSLNNYVSLYLNRLGAAKLGLSYRIGTQNAFNNTTIQNLVYDERYKAAVVYTSSSIKLFLNGQLIIDESNFNYTGLSLNRVEYNYASGNNFGFEMPVNQTLVFPTALSDNECIELTTI